MKVIIHDLGEEITCLLKKTNEDLVVIHADNQYAHCRGCFKCWLKNAGYCVMRDSLRHIGALIGRVIRSSLSAGAVTEDTAALSRPFWIAQSELLFHFSPGAAARPTT